MLETHRFLLPCSPTDDVVRRDFYSLGVRIFLPHSLFFAVLCLRVRAEMICGVYEQIVIPPSPGAIPAPVLLEIDC